MEENKTEKNIEKVLNLFLGTLASVMLSAFVSPQNLFSPIVTSFYSSIRTVHAMDVLAIITLAFILYCLIYQFQVLTKAFSKNLFASKVSKLVTVCGILFQLYIAVSTATSLVVGPTVGKFIESNIETIAPYISENEVLILKSELLQVNTKEKYNALTLKLSNLANENGVELQ